MMKFKGILQRHWRTLLTLLVGVVVFLLSFVPFRVMLNYHEQGHLFRWSGYYLREQLSSFTGFVEYVVSFIVQFFYVPALGALVLALLVMAGQQLVWGLLRLFHRWQVPLYLLSFVPALALYFYAFVTPSYLYDHDFREIVEYDYLERNHRWQDILQKTRAVAPQTDCGYWCTNYALAMLGQLDQMERYPQCGPQGLLNDVMQLHSFALYSMSDIYFQLGCVNEAERMAFNAKQYLPHERKSGRVYRRLAECNLVNGHYTIAAKYLHFLESTLFYRSYAKRWLRDMTDEAKVQSAYARVRQYRQKENRWLTSNAKEVMLARLVSENAENMMAVNYLVAYRVLQLNYPPNP